MESGETVRGRRRGRRLVEVSVAAVAIAAFVVLEQLYPDQREELESRLAISFSHVPEIDAKAEGAALGRKVASEMLTARELAAAQR